MTTNNKAWAVITTPSENLNATFSDWGEVLDDGRLRIADLLPVDPDSHSISTIKNIASRAASRGHWMVHKKAWKQDLDVAREKGFYDYYIRYGKGFCEDMILELIIAPDWR